VGGPWCGAARNTGFFCVSSPDPPLVSASGAWSPRRRPGRSLRAVQTWSRLSPPPAPAVPSAGLPPVGSLQGSSAGWQQLRCEPPSCTPVGGPVGWQSAPEAAFVKRVPLEADPRKWNIWSIHRPVASPPSSGSGDFAPLPRARHCRVDAP
jgi:hypothetical protein